MKLGRPATRAELHAGRRAAHQLAEAGRCQLQHADVRHNGRRKRMLLIGRVGMDSNEWPEGQALELAANVFPTPSPDRSAHALSQTVAATRVAWDWASQVDPKGVSPNEAADAVREMSTAVHALYLLRRELKRRAKDSGSSTSTR